LPSNLQNLPWFQHLQNGGLGSNSTKWSETNPFRTVEGAGQFGGGLNASAGQLYDHFNRKVALDRQAGNEGAEISDYGLTPAQRPQSIADFLDRRDPKPADPSNLWAGQFPGQSQAFADRINALMGERGWDRGYAYRNQTNAINLGADYDKDGAVSDNEWAQYKGGGNQQVAPPKLPGNIPGMGGGLNGIFNLPQFPQQPTGGGTPGVQQPVVSTGMPMVGRPQPGGTPPQAIPTNMGNFLQQTPGVQPPQQPMTNPQMPQPPQIPQFDPSIFNMQPQMMANRPRPMGV
jgi:hypothetical protein